MKRRRWQRDFWRNILQIALDKARNSKHEIRITKFETNSKHEIRNSKQTQMKKVQLSKRYDLEERTFRFSKRVRDFVRNLPKIMTNQEYSRQLIRSSASIGANYIEANESLGKKDFLMRIKICRKEAKESCYWLRLVEMGVRPELERERVELVQESSELMMIFSSIMRKSK